MIRHELKRWIFVKKSEKRHKIFERFSFESLKKIAHLYFPCFDVLVTTNCEPERSIHPLRADIRTSFAPSPFTRATTGHSTVGLLDSRLSPAAGSGTSSAMATAAVPTQSASAPAGGGAAAFARSLASLASISSALSSSVPALAAPTENAKVQVSALWTSAKPWGEFFNGKKFVPPAALSELQERLMDNLTYFSPNYLLCFLVLSMTSVLIHPLSFLCVIVLAGLYVYMFLQNHETLKLGPVKLSQNAKKVLFAVIAFCLLYLTNAIGIIGSWALFGIFLAILHAGCRVSAKEPDFDSPVNSV